ncbi:MAG: hypothetical protein J1F09_01925 [Oscillospiraceae bacterium]|nr:hypothetical protein [Oscillospiraceae bacterium]
MSKPIIIVDRDENGKMRALLRGDELEITLALGAAVSSVVEAFRAQKIYRSGVRASNYGTTLLNILHTNGFTPEEIKQVGSGLIGLSAIPNLFPLINKIREKKKRRPRQANRRHRKMFTVVLYHIGKEMSI